MNNNTDNEKVLEIIEKIKVLPFNVETTIAELIDYDPEKNFIDPLTQGQIFNMVDEICRKEKIYIEENNDEIGGLAFYYKFKKVNNN